MRFAARIAGALAIAACQAAPPAPAAPETLDAYLQRVASLDADARAREIAGWRLEPAAWARTTTDPYRAAYADYAHQFEAAAPALVAQLAAPTGITVRRHLAGDPRLTLGQARARWALPIQFPSQVAELAGAPLDAVFVRDGGAWRAIVGIDAIIQARITALDPACAPRLDHVAAGPCGDASWVVAEAALRADRPRLAHACSLVANLCP